MSYHSSRNGCNICISRIIAGGIVLLISFLPLESTSQNKLRIDQDQVVIGSILLKGNKVTRDVIIRREIPFSEGDTIRCKDLDRLLTEAQQLVFNTSLFNVVDASATPPDSNGFTTVTVTMVERWYLWPYITVEPADRNFSTWMDHMDLSRLTYGVDLTFNNMRGRREILSVPLFFGYNLQAGINYTIPYINRRKTFGISAGGDVAFSREIETGTENNRQLYLQSESGFIREKYAAQIQFLWRPKMFRYITGSIIYQNYLFSHELTEINGFLPSDNTSQWFLSMNYFIKSDHRDAHFYPLKGYYADLEFNITYPFHLARNAYVKPSVRLFIPMGKGFYASAGLSSKISMSRTQPGLFQRAMGYGRDYVRGFEKYVVNGQHFVLLKTQVRYAIVPWHTDRISFIRSEKFGKFPWALYITAFSDLGYTYQYQEQQHEFPEAVNTLSNLILAGTGMGFDFTTYYDIVLRLEGTINSRGGKGFFIHFMAPI